MLEKKELKCFSAKDFRHLSKIKKINFNGINLKTDYLIHIMHECLIKYYFFNETKIDLWSIILKKMYGKFYNYYIDYLEQINFFKKGSNYFVGYKSTTYNLNVNLIDFENITKFTINDNVLINKINTNYLNKTFIDIIDSSINENVRIKLVEDLSKVKINRIDALISIKEMYNKSEIDILKYKKNICSIENIEIKNPFFKFDEYGRMHTNFTILKKKIRQTYLSINDKSLVEIDIKNSQPLFLGLLILKEMPIESIRKSEEIIRYIKVVSNGILYEDILSRCNSTKYRSREDVKTMIYNVFFGKNNTNVDSNRIFNFLYPEIFSFIIDYKNRNGDYKSLSHVLQRMESDFIYNTVINDIIKTNKDITLFTIHDSIICQEQYKNVVQNIFYKHKNILFKNLDI